MNQIDKYYRDAWLLALIALIVLIVAVGLVFWQIRDIQQEWDDYFETKNLTNNF